MKLLSVAGFALLATGLQAQTFHRQAAIVRGEDRDRDRGRCLVEVVVDGAAEIALRSDDATVTNLKGQLPELRRFECTTPIPRGALEFRYAPVSGRGRQELIRPAEGDRPAVIRIEDPQNGADRYVFEITWRREGPPVYSERRDDRRDERHRLSTDEAVDVCRREVRHRLEDRFRPEEVNFREIGIDDAPGRGEWIVGIVEAGRERREPMRFSCSIDFFTGEVREAHLDPIRRDR